MIRNAPPSGSFPPPAPQAGEEVIAYLRKLEDWLRRIVPVSGKNVSVQRSSSGTSINAHATGGAPEALTPPFWSSPSGTPEAPLIAVKFGTVNNYEPTAVSEVEATESGWLLELEADLTGTRYVVIKAKLTARGMIDPDTLADDLLIYLTADDVIPETLPGDEDTGAPPAWAYRVVAKIEGDAGALTITNYLSGVQWLSLIVSNWGCSAIIRNVVWTQ